MPDFQNKRLLGLLAIALVLTACEPNEMYPAGGIPFSGSNSGGSSAPAQQAAPAQRLAPMPIEDPEDANAWGAYRATSEWHCRQLAGGKEYRFDSKTKKCYIKG